MPAAPSATDLQSRLYKHVDILAGLIGERHTEFPAALEATRAYLTRTLVDQNLAPVAHTYATPARSAQNIEVIFPGTKTHLRPLVVGAHYDSAPGTPGADDNASAVAALLEITRAASAKRLKRSLHCVFYDCEEMPNYATSSMGSFQHARGLRTAKQEILGMICLESIGYFPTRVDPAIERPRILRLFDAVLGGRYIVVISDLRSIPFGLPFVLRFGTSGLFPFVPAALPRSFPRIELSDHRSYWEENYPAVMVTNTAVCRNPNYHERSDLPPTLDYPRLARLTAQLTRTIIRTCS